MQRVKGNNAFLNAIDWCVEAASTLFHISNIQLIKCIFPGGCQFLLPTFPFWHPLLYNLSFFSFSLTTWLAVEEYRIWFKELLLPNQDNVIDKHDDKYDYLYIFFVEPVQWSMNYSVSTYMSILVSRGICLKT